MIEQTTVVENNVQLRTLVGKVVSDKMQKTRVILVERKVKHKKYGKYIKRSTKLHVHDEENLSKQGDIIEIVPSRPLSKKKSWRLNKIITKAIT
ncbi:MAG: 30S ribosomal protein S17 [Thiomargarita sp.]|nr:30S ribosomal protein S17 [Thiomargarita sp.]